MTPALRIRPSAPSNEATHAVPEEHELVDGKRPRCDELLEHGRKRPAVRRDVKTAVVAKVERRVTKVACERRAVIVTAARELRVRHARAVDQNEDLRSRIRHGRTQCIRCELDGAAGVSELHLDRERVGGLVQVVAEHAVDDGEHDIALVAGAACLDQRSELREGGIEAYADEPRDALDRCVHGTGGEPRRPCERLTEDGGATRDRDVHLLDERGDPARGFYCQPGGAAELVLLGHSMGGLVARSACLVAGEHDHTWPSHLRALITLGSPHHGAPLERGGNWIDRLLDLSPYTAPLGALGRIRSAGVTDLRFGNVLDEHWDGHDRFAHGHDTRSPCALPDGVRCYAIAGTLSTTMAPRLRSDGLVPVDSALGIHARPELCVAFPEAHRSIALGTGHIDLLGAPAVYTTIRDWLGSPAS